jgi:3-dehydroquinate synthase
LRGVAFLQIPTTLVAMIDSSVGGKTAVNTEFGKNLIGAFYQPNGVLIDVETLQTLARRELSAGFCEAIKQGAIADKKLFAQTAEFLESFSLYKFKNYFLREEFISKLQDLILAQVDFKARIVMQDEKESPERVDNKSRKILNFGHTLAHALEKVTDYKYFKHGEAVGYGILFAAQLSKELGIFDENELKLLNETVYRVGVLPKLDGIDPKRVLEAFSFDKKVVNDSLQWILLKAIGAPIILQNKDITSLTLTKSLIEFLGK